MTEAIKAEPLIEVVREEVTALPAGPTIIATGPLTSPALAGAISAISGENYLYFYDALAPIVTAKASICRLLFAVLAMNEGCRMMAITSTAP